MFCSWLKNCLSRNTVKKLHRKCGECYRKACRNKEGRFEPCDICKLRDWLRDYHLANTDAFSLFNEFLEMGRSKNVSLYNNNNPLQYLIHSFIFFELFPLRVTGGSGVYANGHQTTSRQEYTMERLSVHHMAYMLFTNTLISLGILWSTYCVCLWTVWDFSTSQNPTQT